MRQCWDARLRLAERRRCSMRVAGVGYRRSCMSFRHAALKLPCEHTLVLAAMRSDPAPEPADAGPEPAYTRPFPGPGSLQPKPAAGPRQRSGRVFISLAIRI